MLLTILLVCLSVKSTQSQDYDEGVEKVFAELEIASLELQDDCEDSARTLKLALTTKSFGERIKRRETHGELLKVISDNLKEHESNVPAELIRNWTFLVKPGDPLLREKDWSSLVNYEISFEELTHTATVHCKNDTKDCVFVMKGYESLIGSSRNITLLKRGWSAWQTLISSGRQRFPAILDLVTKAAAQNEVENARAYWEMLTEYQEAYKVADDLWEQIRPLYFKLQNYVKRRLFHFYNITSESEIPVYLLGSNFGSDWSRISDFIVPNPFLYKRAEGFLNKTTIQNIYKMAEETTQDLSLGSLGERFWSNSVFNTTFCDNHLITFCEQEHSELLTCSKVSWSAYLDSFEVAIEATLRGMDYVNLPRASLRHSVVDEVMKNLGSLFAVRNLRVKDIWSERYFEENGSLPDGEATELLLLALRVLPKLPYYLAADKWRLSLLESGFGHMDENWWKFRKEYQGVEGVFNNETDYLGDPYIISNKPYLSKFLGTVLQFHFWQYYKNEEPDPSNNMARTFAKDENFLPTLRERYTTEWSLLISRYYSFYDITAAPLLEFFAPLETYLDSAPLEQVEVTPVPVTNLPSLTTPQSVPAADETKDLNDDLQVEKNITKNVQDESPLPTHHDHVEENIEGENPAMGKITLIIGLALLGVAVAIVAGVVLKKGCAKKRKRNNNRRFEE